VRNGAWRSVLPGSAPKEVALPEGGVDRAV